MSDSSLTLSCSVNGTSYTTNINNALAAINSMRSGSSAPTNNIVDGTLWLDDSSSDNKIKIRIGSTWHTLSDFDGSNFYFEYAKKAAQLETARTIGGVLFNGTSNINLPGVNAAGTQDTSGNATTATTLATARNIGGVSFNGSTNINLPGVNAGGNQNTSGNAATSTKLAATQTIGMTGDVVWTSAAFDGSVSVTSASATIQPSSVEGSMLDTDTAGNGKGKRTVSTSDASGTATNGDIWYKV